MKKAIWVSIIAVVFAHVCNATIVQWKLEDGGNGHCYEPVSFPTGVTEDEIAKTVSWMGSQSAVIGSTGIGWHEANIVAYYRGGHLATIQSRAENDFVFSLIDNSIYWKDGAGPWLGGGQDLNSPTYSEPGGGWVWVNNYKTDQFEAMTYTNWPTFEPNNQGGYENVIHFFERSSYWNDRPSNIPCNSFVIEYESIPEPCTILLLGLGGMLIRK
jgi:hypothetical protein